MEEVKTDLSLLEQAKATAERIEKANAELKLLLDREERLNAEKILGGRAMAGQDTPVAKTPDQILEEQATKFIESVGLKSPFRKV